MNKVKVKYGIIPLFFCVCLMSSSGKRDTGTGKRQLHLVWSDEFAYEGLPDSTKWDYEVGFIRGTEKQYYTLKRLENAYVKEGCLHIKASKEKYQNSSIVQYIYKSRENGLPVCFYRYDASADYTSASLITLGKMSMKYGRIDVRAKLPAGAGVWPAIWMVGVNRSQVFWPDCGEMDIMEFVGKDPHKIHSNVHFPDSLPGLLKAGDPYHKFLPVSDASDSFHVYSMEWTANAIDFFFDDSLYHSFKVDGIKDSTAQIFQRPFYLIINLALGGGWGGKIDDSIFPQEMQVDYVRVFQ